MLRVFVSSTSIDLKPYRAAAAEMIKEQKWFPVMMEDWTTEVDWTLDVCRQRVSECDLLLLIVAFRWGWKPEVDQGGDGQTSATAYEYAEAINKIIPVRTFVASDLTWPVRFCEFDKEAQDRLVAFKKKQNISQLFDHEEVPRDEKLESLPIFRSKVRNALTAHKLWLFEKARAAEPISSRTGGKLVGAESVLEALEESLNRLPLLSHDVLSKAYNNLTKTMAWEPVPVERNPVILLNKCARSLAKASRQSDGTWPLLEFVRQLQHLIPEEKADELESWLADAEVHLSPHDPADAHRKGRSASWPGQDRDPCLHVEIAPSRTKKDHYSVSARLTGPNLQVYPPQKKQFTRKALRDVMPEIHEWVIEHCNTPRLLWVEFCLPRALLDEAVDQWKLDPESDNILVGNEYRVVVRSLKRAEQGSTWTSALLKARWELLQKPDSRCRFQAQDPSKDESGLAVWVGEDDAGAVDLSQRLTEAREVVCALLRNPPRSSATDSHPDILETIFATGVPVVLWTRSSNRTKPDAHRDELRRLLEGGELLHLPDRVLDLRKKAQWKKNDPSHAGRHLTLLWDDPTTAYANTPLQSPQAPR
jgi:hypothetical protein